MLAETPPPETPPRPPVAPRPPRRGGARRLNRLFWLTLLLVAGLAGLPTLIARTSLRQELLPLARPGLPVDTSIGSAELGWFSPVIFRDISIPDLEGRPLLHVGEIRTDRPLWELAIQPTDVGRIAVDQLELALIVRPDGDNLSDLLRRLQQSPSGRSRPRARLECQHGRVSIVDPQGHVLLACEEIELLFDDLLQGDAPVTASVAAVTTAPTRDGRLDLSASWRPGDTHDELVGPGELRFQLDRWPLDPAILWLREPLHASALAGHLSLTVDGRWSQLSAAGGEASLQLTIPEIEAALQPADPRQPLQSVRTRDASWRLASAYDASGDLLKLTESSFRSEWLDGQLTGSLSDLRGSLRYDLSGDLAIKLAVVEDLLPTNIRSEVDVEGLETRRIRLLGVLRPEASMESANAAPAIGLQTDVVWRKLAAYGIQSEEGEVQIAYAGGRLVTVPVRAPVSGGRIVAVPEVQLGADGPTFQFAGGPLLENVAFTPELCRGWLRYLSPLMANTTSVDGTFTLSVDPALVPLRAWPNTDLQGQLRIQSARIGPGPMTQQLLGSIQQIRGLAERRPAAALDPEGQWLTIADQAVDFAVRNGRVEHSNLKLAAGPVQIESRGSVGLVDETLDLLLTIRLPESWFANRPLLAGLQGEGLKIPIRGTLSQPQVEARPLLEFGRGIGLRAADGFLQRLMERRERK